MDAAASVPTYVLQRISTISKTPPTQLNAIATDPFSTLSWSSRLERDYVGRPGDLRCRIEYFQMLIGLNSLQRPTSVPFTSSGVGENLRSQVVELRRYVHHLEAERDEERKKREAIL